MLPEPQGRIAFGTKAETLERLAPLITVSTVPALLWFTIARWQCTRRAVLAEIAARFGSAALAVRSSACGEDGGDASCAGRFRTRLAVPSADVAGAVDDVIAAYPGDPRDQVLVQPMVTDVAVAGVAATHVVDDGAPYWVVSYDDHSGTTDRVTGGIGASKSVLIAHGARADCIESPRLGRWLAMVREVATLAGDAPLEIEFAEDRAGGLWLLQARRIAAARHWAHGLGPRVRAALARVEAAVTARSRRQPGVAGARTILGVMPDWNPAEIIGTTPAPLAASLYARLVTDRTWRVARARLGYRALPDEPLLVTIGGRPYVDVRLSCNSFLPADVAAPVAERLVDAWLDRLDAHPELHDRLEFEIVPTVLDLDFRATFRARYGDLLGADLSTYRESLRRLTCALLERGPRGTLHVARADVAALAARQRASGATISHAAPPTLAAVVARLDECERLGTVPFAMIARHAFAAEALLRSATARGALAPDRLQAFKSSLVLVTGTLLDDLRAVAAGELTTAVFLERYGHLRPGTYDIRSRRYDQRPELFTTACAATPAPVPTPFLPTATETCALDALLAEAGLATDAAGLLDYAATAIAAREHAKLVFSRSLSDALELLAHWGAPLGLGREQLAHVPLEGIRFAAAAAPHAVAERVALLAEEGRAGVAFARTLRLGDLVRDHRDVHVVPLHRSAPSFVGTARVEGRAVLLDGLTRDEGDLRGAVVCVANADPGFDWIFARGIAGLVTAYGGSHSHMAIRCAELRIPAALGCGELAFARLLAARRIELDCGARVVRPVA